MPVSCKLIIAIPALNLFFPEFLNENARYKILLLCKTLDSNMFCIGIEVGHCIFLPAQ